MAIAAAVMLVGACATREAAEAPPVPTTVAPVTPGTKVRATDDTSVPIAKEEPKDDRDTPVASSRESTFVDRSPPRGWKQCAGFTNTAGDDIGTDFLDGCLNTSRLRIRVFYKQEIEEDVFVEGITPRPTWPEHNYLAGTQTHSVIVKATYWGEMEGGPSSAFFIGSNGKDACGQPVAQGGITFGSGHAQKAIIAPAATGYDEYRVSCGKAALPERSIALYR